MPVNKKCERNVLARSRVPFFSSNLSVATDKTPVLPRPRHNGNACQGFLTRRRHSRNVFSTPLSQLHKSKRFLYIIKTSQVKYKIRTHLQLGRYGSDYVSLVRVMHQHLKKTLFTNFYISIFQASNIVIVDFDSLILSTTHNNWIEHFNIINKEGGKSKC